MGNILSRRRSSKRPSGVSPANQISRSRPSGVSPANEISRSRPSGVSSANEISRSSPMMEVYGVFIVRFIQILHDHILEENRKGWGSSVVIDLRFPTSDPERLVAATARDPANSNNRKEMLKKLKLAERKACDRLDWGVFFDWVEEGHTQVEEEFRRFKLELADRGRLNADLDITTTNPSVDSPSKDSEIRLLHFQLRFHDHTHSQTI